MNASCSFSLEGSYQLKYSSVISGYIRQNKLTDLSGVKVKVLFIWLSIVEVTRNADKLQLELHLLILGFIISLYARNVAVDWIAMLWMGKTFLLFLRFKPRFLLEKDPPIRRWHLRHVSVLYFILFTKKMKYDIGACKWIKNLMGCLSGHIVYLISTLRL
ncbi:uncharacterized protein LOC121805657 [Salvia splendens]|uniref:uncharacterized protein LOC121805657 n=1 Tax=Salvia splendens TaxID=180675 RepID=UPI001C263C80|nr:uncharacterized protein LOC121805657 [Salvia splendens]